MSNQVHHAVLLEKKLIAQQTEMFVFENRVPLVFKPGQFVSIQVGMDANQNPILRSYSIASSAYDQKKLTLILRMMDDGAGTQFFRALLPHDSIRFTGPFGYFVNEPSHPGDIIYAATGTGIAPIYPMLQEILTKPCYNHIVLYWGLRHPEDLFFQNEFDLLCKEYPKLDIKVFYSQPPTGFLGQQGRIVKPLLEQVPSFQEPVFYLCGNGQMIQEIKTALQQKGINRKKQIRTESFFD